jgi:hypothetical protein
LKADKGHQQMSLSSELAKKFSNYGSQQSVGSKLRAKRIGPLLKMIEAAFNEKRSVSIIDVGGTEEYWGIISRQYLIDRDVNITIVNLPGTTISEDHGPFKFVEGDACNLVEFDDMSFDIAHSNSVVEHVGDWARMVRFAEEISRVSRNYFVQTPNYWFPIEPHCMTPFFHWLPEPIRVWLVLRFQLGHWNRAGSTTEAVTTVQSARLMNKSMFQALFKDAVVSTERFLLLSKSLIAIRDEKG